MSRRITVVGLGLLGGSFLQALADRKFDAELQGVSSPETLAQAKEAGLIARGWDYAEVDSWKAESDLIVLATPIDRIAELLRALAASPARMPEGGAVTDVGSTKGEICALAAELFRGEGSPLFVGGHPMTGSEQSGFGARDGSLFESALWLLCPPGGREVPGLLASAVDAVGARRVVLAPGEHDRHVAWVSHLPQSVATVLAAAVGRHSPESVALSGQGFRDMTRLAESSWPMWRGIYRTNPKALDEAFGKTLGLLGEFREAVASGDFDALEKLFGEGRGLRTSVPKRNKGFANALVDLAVDVTDRPGALLGIVRPLTEAGIDIRDVALLKVREGVGGHFRISFRSTQEALRAQEILAKNGFDARPPA